MRTLSEIIDAAKDGSPTTHEECLYALLAYSSLHWFTRHSLQCLVNKPSKFRTVKDEWEEEFRRFKTALTKSPKEWIGWDNDPSNPEYVKRIKVGRKFVDKFFGEIVWEASPAAKEDKDLK